MEKGKKKINLVYGVLFPFYFYDFEKLFFDITFNRYSYCLHYRLSYKRKSCDNTWASTFRTEIPVCVECQSRVMNGGHCRGEGAVGVRTRWKALGVPRCHGDWIRLGEIIPNCTCGEKQFANFVFV